MPRERIDVEDGQSLRVGWGRDSVQVAAGVSDLEVNGEKHAEIWAHLRDRNSVNHLIRTLRKARDSAFGADA